MCFLRVLQLQAFCEADTASYYTNKHGYSKVYLIVGFKTSAFCVEKSSQEVTFQCRLKTQVFSLCPLSLIYFLFFYFLNVSIYIPIDLLRKGSGLHVQTVYVHVCFNKVLWKMESWQTVYCNVWMKELECKCLCQWQEWWSLISCRVNAPGWDPVQTCCCLANAEDNTVLCK